MRNPLKRLFALATHVRSSLAAMERVIDLGNSYDKYEAGPHMIKAADYTVTTHVASVGRSISVTFRNVPLIIQWAVMKLVWLKLSDSLRFEKFEYLPGRNGMPAAYVARHR
jgi:hypothetical protein